jgi:hypothetical protein
LVFSVQSRYGSHAPLHPGDCLAGNCLHVDPVDAILQRSFEFFQGDVRDDPRRFPALIIGLDCFADDFDDGLRDDGIVPRAYSMSSHSSTTSVPSRQLFLADSLASPKWAFIRSLPMLLALSKPAWIWAKTLSGSQHSPAG